MERVTTTFNRYILDNFPMATRMVLANFGGIMESIGTLDNFPMDSIMVMAPFILLTMISTKECLSRVNLSNDDLCILIK